MSNTYCKLLGTFWFKRENWSFNLKFWKTMFAKFVLFLCQKILQHITFQCPFLSERISPAFHNTHTFQVEYQGRPSGPLQIFSLLFHDFFGRKRKVSDIADVWKFVSFPGLGYFEQDQPGMKRNKSISKDLADQLFLKTLPLMIKFRQFMGHHYRNGLVFSIPAQIFFHGWL